MNLKALIPALGVALCAAPSAKAAPVMLGSPLTAPFEYAGTSLPFGAERLPAARKKLIQAGCRLGKVRGRRTRTALVVSQSPQTGTRLAAGGKVGVVLRPKSSPGRAGRERRET